MSDIELIGGRHAVLLIHGLSSSPLEMRYIARELHRKGYTVRVPHFRGYGYGEKIPSRQNTWPDWYRQVEDHFDDLLRQYDSVSVAGLCIGAVLALRLASARKEVRALSLLATTLFYDGWSMPWYRFLLPLGFYTPLRYFYSYRERYPFGLKDARLRDLIMREMAETSESAAGAASLPMTNVYQARRLIADTRKRLKDVRAPALIVHAIEDDVASIRSARYVEQNISSPISEMVLLQNSYHIISMDNEKRIVAQKTIDFFLKHRDKETAEIKSVTQPAARKYSVLQVIL